MQTCLLLFLRSIFCDVNNKLKDKVTLSENDMVSSLLDIALHIPHNDDAEVKIKK